MRPTHRASTKPAPRRLCLQLSAALALTLSLTACGGSPPKPPPPPELDLTVTAGANQNPEIDGKPAPVSIKIYQLASTGGFLHADVYALMNSDAAVLGQDLIASEVISATPGSTQKIHKLLKPGAAFLGVAVLFRDIDHATWRATAPLAANGLTSLTLKTMGLSMTLAP